MSFSCPSRVLSASYSERLYHRWPRCLESSAAIRSQSELTNHSARKKRRAKMTLAFASKRITPPPFLHDPYLYRSSMNRQSTRSGGRAIYSRSVPSSLSASFSIGVPRQQIQIESDASAAVTIDSLLSWLLSVFC